MISPYNFGGTPASATNTKKEGTITRTCSVYESDEDIENLFRLKKCFIEVAVASGAVVVKSEDLFASDVLNLLVGKLAPLSDEDPATIIL